jgi:hypothetical protein
MQDLAAIHALPAAFSGEERRWYRGLAVIKGKVIPVVNESAFLSKAEAVLLAAAAETQLREIVRA